MGAYPRQISKLNTFQIVLSTNGDLSFVFFLYHDLQWSESSSSRNSYAQAGFNAGDGIAFEMLPHSRTKDVVRLINESNINIPGLFVFRVDTDTIDAGGCTTNVSIVSFRPHTGSQLGSTALNIYGVCFTNETKVKCHFNTLLQTTDGFIIDKYRAICLTPFASVHGLRSVSVSIDDGKSFIPAGTFTYAPLKFGSDEVLVETEDGDNLLSVGQYIKLRWHFTERVRNTFSNGTKIDIELWKVSLNNQSHLHHDNVSIILAQNLPLNDSIRIQLPPSISYLSVCFIRIIARLDTQIYAGLNTGLLLIRSHSLLAPELCHSWAVQQSEPSTWNDDLRPCPMTRQQAVAAGRCCYESDRQCYRDSSNPNNCWLHQARPERNESSAIECYVSIISNSHGAAAECCYDNHGIIITRGTGAGTDDRYRQATSPVRHFFYDTLPYLQCCLISTSVETCNTYMYYRPPRRGSNTMGENGLMWGDPHLSTLDGTTYTFNGYGEYIYLAISNESSPTDVFNMIDETYIFVSQIRTVPISSNGATVVKGFAARFYDVNDEAVSITVSRREHLILRRGNESLEFDEDIDTLFFPEMTLYRLDGNNNSRFLLSWPIGITIAINVTEIALPSRQLVLSVVASVTGVFRGKNIRTIRNV